MKGYTSWRSKQHNLVYILRKHKGYLGDNKKYILDEKFTFMQILEF